MSASSAHFQNQICRSDWRWTAHTWWPRRRDGITMTPGFHRAFYTACSLLLKMRWSDAVSGSAAVFASIMVWCWNISGQGKDGKTEKSKKEDTVIPNMYYCIHTCMDIPVMIPFTDTADPAWNARYALLGELVECYLQSAFPDLLVGSIHRSRGLLCYSFIFRFSRISFGIFLQDQGSC